MMMKFPKVPTVCGYVGAVIMVIFAFTMSPGLAVVGLTLLSVQSINVKMWNLVVLNAISICGFASQLLV